MASSAPPRYKTSLDEVKGEFLRSASQYRNWIGDENGAFPAESGRYHLYVSYACPWASRCLAVRAHKGLDEAISVSVVEPVWGTVDESTGARGWVFAGSKGVWPDSHIEGATPDHLHGNRVNSLFDLYLLNDSHYVGKATVPVLWDKQKSCIVNNESSDIIRMLNCRMNDFAKHPERTLFPAALEERIAEERERMYNSFNNGVYRCGFASSQEAYEKAYHDVFATLDYYEALLGKQQWICGSVPTIADLCFFVTAVRFDAVYVGHFRANRNRLLDMPNIWGWLRNFYQAVPGIKETVNMTHIKHHYHRSHKTINLYGLVPLGPAGLDFESTHGRDEKFRDLV